MFLRVTASAASSQGGRSTAIRWGNSLFFNTPGHNGVAVLARSCKARTESDNPETLAHGAHSTDASDTLTCRVARQYRTISMSERHTCALDLSGKAYCWGTNSFGQLGNGRPDGIAYMFRSDLSRPSHRSVTSPRGEGRSMGLGPRAACRPAVPIAGRIRATSGWLLVPRTSLTSAWGGLSPAELRRRGRSTAGRTR